MAAVTPQDDGAVPSTGSRYDGLRAGTLTTGGTQTFITNGTTIAGPRGLTPIVFLFLGVGDGDTWTGAPRGCVDVYWKGSDVDADFVLPYITTFGGIGQPCVIEFQTTGAGKNGWLLCLCKG